MGLCGSKNAVADEQQAEKGRKPTSPPAAAQQSPNGLGAASPAAGRERSGSPPPAAKLQSYPTQKKHASPISKSADADAEYLVPAEVAMQVQEQHAPLALQILQHGFASKQPEGMRKREFKEEVQHLNTAPPEDKLDWVLSVLFGGAAAVSVQEFVRVFSSLSPGSEAALMELVTPLVAEEGDDAEDDNTLSLGAIRDLLFRILPGPALSQLLALDAKGAEQLQVQEFDDGTDDDRELRQPQATQ